MGRIPDDDVQKVREATDIVQLVSESVVLKQKGRLHWGLCPFHQEKTPSFKVDPASGLWHCFGCGTGGDALAFLMQRENLDFPDAVRELAERAGIEIREEGGMSRSERERLVRACEEASQFFHDTLLRSREPAAERARDYLSSRGLGLEVAKRFNLGYAPSGRDTLVRALERQGVARNELVAANLAVLGEGGRLKDRFFDRVMFPISDLSGHVVAFGGRVVGEGNPKYLNSQETPVFSKSRVLYALDRAKSQIVLEKTAIVVEGYTDVIALHEVGVRNVVATLGTALTAQHVRLLARFAERVVYLFDGDEAGRRAASRTGEFLAWQATPERSAGRVDLLVAMIPEGGDPADYVSLHGPEALKGMIEAAQPLLRFMLDRRLDAHDVSSPEGRSAALKSSAGVLAGLKGSLLGHDYVNYVADRLGVDLAAVQDAVRRAKPEVSLADEGAPLRAGGAETEVANVLIEPHRRAEEELVRLAVLLPRVRPQARELLEHASVATRELAELLGLVVEAGDATGTDLWRAVEARNRDAAERISAWLVEPAIPDGAESVFGEVAGKVKDFALERQIRELRHHMEGLDPVKHRTEYDDVFRKVHEMQRELKRTRGARFEGNLEER